MLNKSSTVLIVVDVQGKLAQIMLNKEQLIDNIVRLIQGCKLFGIPIIWMEQTPDKLGPTVPKIAAVLDDNVKITKRTFSCYGEQEFCHVLEEMNRQTVLICGIETHVCVYQTACDLLQKDYQVQVVTDAVLAGVEGDLHITAATPAITISGTPQVGDIIHLKISRNIGGTDDMAEDAWLFGVMLQITVNQNITAW